YSARGWDRPRSIPTSCGRRWPRWRKARASRRGNSSRRMAVRFETLDGRPPHEAGIVDRGLDAFNGDSARLDGVAYVTCGARNGAGEVIGGAVGRTWGECAELLQLWVAPEHR